ncbi:hypothetical protein APX70_02414 [Pseudomonas syringae pv. maculicola]|uniref:Uncharacterized protein n=1 Tax=Pseudomonas syringae pv. maculicola TaxID=59511 RepID=A0A3M2VVV7_PSEYM|nr:hypothetical protein APX70_02414 [Pseudomonas syringae pv. maculicola]
MCWQCSAVDIHKGMERVHPKPMQALGDDFFSCPRRPGDQYRMACRCDLINLMNDPYKRS